MTPTTIAEVLNAAADLLEREGAWTQGAFARKSDGGITSPFMPFATCFCLRGAICRVSGKNLSDNLDAFNKALGFRSAQAMANWNDAPDQTQTEVVQALRNAAAMAVQS